MLPLELKIPKSTKSLYAQYIEEREPEKRILETEKGFATYYISAADQMCYIIDVFVLKEFRQTGESREMINRISKIAKNQGSHTLILSVDASTKGSDTSIKVAQSLGFTLSNVAPNNLIMFTKEIL